MMFKKVSIIGAGPCGVRAARTLLKSSDDFAVTIFNGEQVAPYRRAELSHYLAGDLELGELDNHLSDEPKRLTQYSGCEIRRVDPYDRQVVDQYGRSHDYDKLIFATGSIVTATSIVGEDKTGVYHFRSLEDARALLACRNGNQNIYVVGSGPLGIETALAMKTSSNNVYLQVRNHLLSNSLDEKAKGVLLDYIYSTGVTILDNATVVQILGNDQVMGVKLSDGTILNVHSVVMCTGIMPNAGLAARAGLGVHHGIVVDQFMQTSHKDVYAIGECTEYYGRTHGLMKPGYEQTDTCVKHILNKPEPYKYEAAKMQLKFHGFSSQVLGDVDETDCQVYFHRNRLKNIYRKLIVQGHVIKGAVIIGNWSEIGSVVDSLVRKKKVLRQCFFKFTETGRLFSDDTVLIQNQPADYIICLCKGITRGEVSMAMKEGHRTLDAFGGELEAGITCGSCRPLLMQMVEKPVSNLIMRHHRKILWASVSSVIIIVLTTFVPRLPFERSVQFSIQFEQVWYGSGYKQLTGYILLVLALLSAALALRKRWKKLDIGNLDNWRYAHTILGLIALAALIVHTGFRFGENLNFVLMSVFMLATLTGSLVGIFMSRNHHWTDLKLTQHRAWWSRVHYGLLWMLPSLLSFHIISSYFFA